jgi:multimeric flavodoxin WrbA
MKTHLLDQEEIKLCIDCFHCKKKKNKIYCKFGVWKETDTGKSILHMPYDFNCPEWTEA